MKLKTFDQEPKSSRKSKSLRVRLCKIGSVYFNNNLSEELGLIPGQGVDFHQDQESPKDWYLSINPKSANKIRQKSPANSFLFNNARLVEAIMKSVNMESSDSVSFPVSGIPVTIDGKKGEYYAIITSALITSTEEI